MQPESCHGLLLVAEKGQSWASMCQGCATVLLSMGFQRTDPEICNFSTTSKARGVLNSLFQEAVKHHGISLTANKIGCQKQSSEVARLSCNGSCTPRAFRGGTVSASSSLPPTTPEASLYQQEITSALPVFRVCYSSPLHHRTLHDTNTQVKVSFYFSCNLLILYPYDGKISTVPGRAA